jgi:hypothetical protein
MYKRFGSQVSPGRPQEGRYRGWDSLVDWNKLDLDNHEHIFYDLDELLIRETERNLLTLTATFLAMKEYKPEDLPE